MRSCIGFRLKGRADESIRGLICSEDILYFILVSGMFLGFSVLKLQFARRSCSVSVKVGKIRGIGSLCWLCSVIFP